MDPTLQLRIGAIFALLASSLVGFFSPYGLKSVTARSSSLPIQKEESEREEDSFDISSSMVFRAFKVFTGGLLLSVAVLHLLVDARANLSTEIVIEATNDYPITEVILLAGVSFPPFMGVLVKYLIAFTTKYPSVHETAPKDASLLGVPPAFDTTPTDGALCTHEHFGSGMLTMTKLWILEISVAVHSIAIGFALGTEENADTIKALLIALCFHQLCEGFILGYATLERGLQRQLVLLLIVIFSLSTSVGVVIGILVKSTDDLVTVDGAVNAFAAGCLVYTSIADILNEEFTKVVEEPVYAKAVLVAATLTGFTCMGVLALWA
jgi:zinc transporter 1/2/3